MHLRHLLHQLLTFLVPLALLSTVYIYLYPAFHGCAFPVANDPPTTAYQDAFRQLWPLGGTDDAELSHNIAPFRLLVLADPQLEGDSSLPNPNEPFLLRLAWHWNRITEHQASFTHYKTALQRSLKEVVLADIPDALQAARKRVDLLGNDYYLAHIYRTLHRWTRPTHVAVLGDLIGSQWVTDEEFVARGWRYWSRVFAAGQRVEDNFTVSEVTGEDQQGAAPRSFDLSESNWTHRIINLAGNHDIGYAGDISTERIARFEKVFGRANWDIRFQLATQSASNESDEAISPIPSLHLVVLNSLNLDTPALSPACQDDTYAFLNSLITSRSRPVEDRSSFTLLLTHLPLHKLAGVCVDAPYFSFYRSDDDEGRYKAGGLKEQNHLSSHVSQQGILEGIFGISNKIEGPGGGRGRNGLILTGHDHEGCDVWHHIVPESTSPDSPPPQSQDEEPNYRAKPEWQAIRWQHENNTHHNASSSSSSAPQPVGIREVTLRSMMGDFGGNAGLLSVWFDLQLGEWKYEIVMCSFGVQHIWWGVHVLDFVILLIALAWVILGVFALSGSSFADKRNRADKIPAGMARIVAGIKERERGRLREEQARRVMKPHTTSS